MVERSEDCQNFVVQLYGSVMEGPWMVLSVFVITVLLNEFLLLAVGCCYKDKINPQECLCTGTHLDDPDTPGSCCMDDVENPGNCCKFVQYHFAKFSLINLFLSSM